MVKLKMENTDILIFAGQSNMQGETEGLPSHNIAIENALEYRFLSDEFIPLKHPVGENINGDMLLGAKNDCGTLVPDFCDEYIKNTGKNVIAVHTARCGTKIHEWLKGTPRYDSLVAKINAAYKKVKENYNIGKIYFIWLQGESDAIKGTSKESYENMIIEFKNAIKSDLYIDKFCIIEVGYFCRTVSWLDFSKTEEGKIRDEKIMSAQQSVSENDNDFIMLTDICKSLSLDSDYINPYVEGHYNNKGMALIGAAAGKELAEYDKKINGEEI